MLITGKKRIRKIGKYLAYLEEGNIAYIGLSLTEEVVSRLKEIGFESGIVGETLIPSPKLGNISKFNANGREVPQRDLPKETLYRQHLHSWTDWHGTDYSRIVDIPYKRFPRKLIPGPWVSLTIIKHNDKQFVVAGDAIIKGKTPDKDIIHRINLMLEIFKCAAILQENLEQYEVPKVKKLDWDILPSGKMPWEQFQKSLMPLLERASNNKKVIITERLETVSQYNPDFHAIGKNGYRGYIIFGFIELNLYVFETAEYGNATYVFEGNWKEISQMTKTDIVAGNLHKHRFIHKEGWKKQVKSLFPSNDDKKIS